MRGNRLTIYLAINREEICTSIYKNFMGNVLAPPNWPFSPMPEPVFSAFADVDLS